MTGRRRNPFPGVSRVKDRHGRTRYRFRRAGVDAYINEAYNSPAFVAAYDALANGASPKPAPRRMPTEGTLDWLIATYYGAPDFARLAPATKTKRRGVLEAFRADTHGAKAGPSYGARKFREMRREHVEAILARKASTPAAANKLLKILRTLFRFGMARNLAKTDPTAGVKPFKVSPDGFHTWTDAEIDRFERRHPAGSRARLALRLALYTGAARQDLIRMGRHSLAAGRIAYRRGKTGGEVNLPIMPELAEELARIPDGQLLFLQTEAGAGFTAAGFGNWFSDRCVEAGVNAGRLHGLRKAGATRLAEAGGTEHEIAAFLGHATTQEARTYTKKADRARLADSAMEKLKRRKAERSLSNHPPKLGETERK